MNESHLEAKDLISDGNFISNLNEMKQSRETREVFCGGFISFFFFLAECALFYVIIGLRAEERRPWN